MRPHAGPEDDPEDPTPRGCNVLLFVVLSETEGSHAVAVFSTRARALTFIEERAVQNPRVDEVSLPDEYEYPAEVYGAQGGPDASQFVALFIDRAEAEAAAGAGGHVKTFRPDRKHVEDMH